MKKALFIFLLLLISFKTLRVNAETQYTIIDLGTLDNGTESSASGINDSGQIAGSSYTIQAYYNTSHPFIYDGSEIYDLGVPAGGYGTAYDINDNGYVSGTDRYVSEGYYVSKAFLYDGTTRHNFGTLGGSKSWGFGINNNGFVVGESLTEGDTFVSAFLYDGIEMHNLGALQAGTPSSARAINDNGHVTGWSGLSSYEHAYFYDGTTMHDIGYLGTSRPRRTLAFDINNNDQIVGSCGVLAFLYSDGTMNSLGHLGGSESDAYGINDSGQVVGRSWITGNTTPHAFLYDGSVMIDLNTLLQANSGWELTEARDINNLGQIVGQGKINGEKHAFLLTPIPEPCTLLLLGMGGMLIKKR